MNGCPGFSTITTVRGTSSLAFSSRPISFVAISPARSRAGCVVEPPLVPPRAASCGAGRLPRSPLRSNRNGARCERRCQQSGESGTRDAAACRCWAPAHPCGSVRRSGRKESSTWSFSCPRFHRDLGRHKFAQTNLLAAGGGLGFHLRQQFRELVQVVRHRNQRNYTGGNPALLQADLPVAEFILAHPGVEGNVVHIFTIISRAGASLPLVPRTPIGVHTIWWYFPNRPLPSR